ncbi:MAG: hypothetical protein A7316_07525 [Candidatus Altiarchaeales archaeon WOR_SM1_86-2]|nr:MAG: hypothetical protein A7316_07525 [Candidatus Altiarchaeales archaeon WOR_SM1_86-2]
MKCAVCGKEIKGEYLQARVDRNLKPTDKGDVVCSTECADKYAEDLPHRGSGVQHWSRITGYYQNVVGWNKGKVLELKDRQRYGIR